MLALMIVSGILMYFIMTGIAYRIMERRHRRLCGRCSDEIGGYTGAGCEWPECVWFFSGLAWPLAIPLFIGLAIGSKPITSIGTSRQERRRAQQIAEAHHQAELARIRRIEDAELTAQLAAIERKR